MGRLKCVQASETPQEIVVEDTESDGLRPVRVCQVWRLMGPVRGRCTAMPEFSTAGGAQSAGCVMHTLLNTAELILLSCTRIDVR